jgi:hypothetical protein
MATPFGNDVEPVIVPQPVTPYAIDVIEFPVTVMTSV